MYIQFKGPFRKCGEDVSCCICTLILSVGTAMGNKGKDLVAAKATGWIKTVTLQLKHPKPLDTPEEDMFVIFSVDKILQTPLSLLQDGSTTQQITSVTNIHN